jgi:hypothetical protein
MKKIIQFIILLLVISCIPDNLSAQIIEDTVLFARDSAIEPPADPTTIFFQQAEKIKTPEKIFLITKAKKTVTLKKFLAVLNGEITDSPVYADHGLSDLDGDGKNELLLWNYTGGPHCCDEIYLFKNIGVNKYQQVAKIFAGHTAITANKQFEYNLYENFGYFFTCYACSYTDTTDAAPIDVSAITLRYKAGKLAAVPGDKEMRSIINDNLAKLGEQLYVKLDEAGFDEGLRKEFAINLAAYYFLFGKNLPATQQLFNKYYKYPDAKKVWAAFIKQHNYLKSQSDF